MHKILDLDIITASNGDIERCRDFLLSLSKQTYIPTHIYILLYPEDLTQKRVDTRAKQAVEILGAPYIQRLHIYRHGNCDYTPGQGIGYDRDFRLQLGVSTYIYLIDDDNSFEQDFLRKSMDEYRYITDLNTTKEVEHRIEKTTQKNKNTLIYSPSVLYADSHKIQSQGILGLTRAYPKYKFYTKNGQVFNKNKYPTYHDILMMGGNSLLGERKIMQEQGFDYAYISSYEDVDFTISLQKKGHRLVCSSSTAIYHHESKLDSLSSRFLGSDKAAYRRSRSRIRWAWKHTTTIQWLVYICLGLRIQTAGFLVLIGVYTPRNNLLSRLRAVISGTWDGIFQKNKQKT